MQNRSLLLTFLQDSLDNINQQANEKYSKAFSDFFQQKLNVPAKRGYITFIDPGRGNMGYATFSTTRRLAKITYFKQSDMTAPHLPPFLEQNKRVTPARIKKLFKSSIRQATVKCLHVF